MASKRIDFIYGLAARSFFWEQSAIINAFVACISAKEACEALDTRNPVSWTLREALLRKISRDILSEGAQTCHLKLVDSLMTDYPSLPHKRRSGCGYCLSYLYADLPEAKQNAIIEFFLRSPHLPLRRRGLRILQDRWNPIHARLVKDVWKSTPDLSCALLILKRIDEAFVREHLSQIVGLLKGTGYLARPYLRLKDPSITDNLASLDEITYAYLRAKEKRPLTVSDAIALFERNKLDERIGLLIWSFGQMGLWEVLETVTKKANRVAKLRLVEIRKRYSSGGGETPE
jgi:hypothetical protein